MKQLLFILLLFVSKLLQAQQNEIPKEVKSIFEGLWECNNKYQSNKIKITFEPGKEYAIFNDIGNGMAPAKILHASMEKENLFVIPAVQYQNDYTEFKVERGNLYLKTRMITWDSAGNILSKGNLKTKIFKRVSPQKHISVSIAKITKSEFYQKKQ